MMGFEWDYPLFLIAHGGGYASIVDTQASAAESGREPPQLLVVHTSQDAAESFMMRFEIFGATRMLHNAREFRWLLDSLRAPVSKVAFDPDPQELDVNARWVSTVARLRESLEHVDLSPWNYPVYVIATGTGFACIAGSGGAEETWTAIGLFSQRAKAEHYLVAAGEEGTLCELADLPAARRFLGSLESISAVALDPTVDGERRVARHCFSLATLLDKYLVKS